MSFFSTRGGACVTASQAVLWGLAKDGGLYVPSMSSLDFLSVANNLIADVSPLLDKAKLKQLFLAGNPITDWNKLASLATQLDQKDFDPAKSSAANSEPIVIKDKLLKKALQELMGIADRDITMADAAGVTMCQGVYIPNIRARESQPGVISGLLHTGARGSVLPVAVCRGQIPVYLLHREKRVRAGLLGIALANVGFHRVAQRVHGYAVAQRQIAPFVANAAGLHRAGRNGGRGIHMRDKPDGGLAGHIGGKFAVYIAFRRQAHVLRAQIQQFLLQQTRQRPLFVRGGVGMGGFAGAGIQHGFASLRV